MLFKKTLALSALAGLTAAQNATTPTLAQLLSNTTDLSTLNGLLANDTTTLNALTAANNITILAPNNAAFATFLNATPSAANDSALVSALLTYHVLTGTYQNFSANATFIPTNLAPGPYANVTGGQVVEVRNNTAYSGLRDNSTIVTASVNFTGGVVHIIDTVLTLPPNVSDTALAYGFTSFYGALNATNLLETVDTSPDLTIFVPNNGAFANIGSALAGLTPENVTSILNYHVVSGNGTVYYSNTLSNTSVPTLGGSSLNITVINSTTVFVNNARVVIPDIIVGNGVVHVIDEVLNPGNVTVPTSGGSEGQPAFSGASSASDTVLATNAPSVSPSRDASSAATQATQSSSSSSAGAWAPGATGGAFGAAALGGLALIMQL